MRPGANTTRRGFRLQNHSKNAVCIESLRVISNFLRSYLMIKAEQTMQPMEQRIRILNMSLHAGKYPATRRMIAAEPLLATPIQAVTSPFLDLPPISTANAPLIVL